MADKMRHVSSADSRHRVAYEMALLMWHKTNQGRDPGVEDKDKFLELVSECTMSLVHYNA